LHTEGSTAVDVAARNKHAEVVMMLLANKADVNARGIDDDSTALHGAEWSQHGDGLAVGVDSDTLVSERKTTATGESIGISQYREVRPDLE